MADTYELNIKIPDKLYIAMKKAAELKSISINELTNMICTNWIMEQTQAIKGILEYPETLLIGLDIEKRSELLNIIAFGGYTYNQHGEASYNTAEDDESDDVYASLVSQEEIDKAFKKLQNKR